MEPSLKVMDVLGVTMLVLNSHGWLLWSYVVEILCLDTDKTGCVNKVLIFDILIYLRDPKFPLAAESEKDDCASTKYVYHRILWVAHVVICG